MTAQMFSVVGRIDSASNAAKISMAQPSRFLFVGQTAASVGFTAYSALVGNWVFTVTNGLMLLSAIIGWYLTARFKRERPSRPQPAAMSGSAATP